MTHNDKSLKNKVKVVTKNINDILDVYCSEKSIDFISIDVEGFDAQIIKSFNFRKYAPKFFIVEDFCDFEKQIESDIYKLLKANSYEAQTNVNEAQNKQAFKLEQCEILSETINATKSQLKDEQASLEETKDDITETKEKFTFGKSK